MLFRSKNNKGNVKHPVTWMFATAKAICEKNAFVPYYTQMFKEVDAAGYKPGDKLLLYPDKESQFRFDDPPASPIPKTGTIEHNRFDKPKVAINMNNEFLKRFGIPAWTKENDAK